MAGTNPILPPANDDAVRFDPAVIGEKVSQLEVAVDKVSAPVNTTVNTYIGDSFITPVLPEFKWLAPAIYNITNTTSSVLFNASYRGKIFFVLFVLHSETPIDTIAISINVAVATGKVRLGIYDEKDGRPDTLVVDAGEVSAASTGTKLRPLANPVTLSPGRYYVAVNLQDTVNSTGSVSGATVQGVVAFKYHDGVGSALGTGSNFAPNPVFFTEASTYTSGALPANTSDGSILFNDTGSTAYSFYPRCAIRAGQYPGNVIDTDRFFHRTVSPAIAGPTGGFGDKIYWIDETSNKLNEYDLSTGTFGSQITPPAAYTNTSTSRVTHGDNALWIGRESAGPTDNAALLAIAYYNGSGFTEYDANTLVNQAYGLTGARTSPYLGMHPSYAAHNKNGTLYAVVTHASAANDKVIAFTTGGVTSTVDIPVGLGSVSNFSFGHVLVEGNHMWVLARGVNANDPTKAAYYNGSTWSSVYTLPGTNTSNGPTGGRFMILPDGTLLRIRAGYTNLVDTAGNHTSLTTTWASGANPYARSDAKVLITDPTYVTTTNITNYLYPMGGAIAQKNKDGLLRYSTWEIPCPRPWNGKWVIVRQGALTSVSDDRVYQIYTLPV